MADSAYLASSALTGVLLIGVLAYLVRMATRRRYAAALGDRPGIATELAGSPVAWTVSFLALTLGLGLGAVVFVSGASAPGVDAGAVGAAIAALALLVLGLFFFFGIYRSARYRGLKSAQAAGMGTWLVGMVVIAAVLVKLLVA